MDTKLSLPFGASAYLLPGTKAAWGARLIVTQQGDVDFVWDRQGADGDEALKAETLAWLNGGVIRDVIDQAADMLRKRVILTNEACGAWLYEDRRGVVLGNTNGSCGYLYVVAWLFDALPDGCTTKGADVLVEELARARAGA